MTHIKCNCTLLHFVTLLLDGVDRLTCLLTSAPASVSHTTQWGCPPNAAVCVGVWLKRLVTMFTSQPICTRRTTHSSCEHQTQNIGQWDYWKHLLVNKGSCESSHIRRLISMYCWRIPGVHWFPFEYQVTLNGVDPEVERCWCKWRWKLIFIFLPFPL